jgi:hypothetical protein
MVVTQSTARRLVSIAGGNKTSLQWAAKHGIAAAYSAIEPFEVRILKVSTQSNSVEFVYNISSTSAAFPTDTATYDFGGAVPVQDMNAALSQQGLAFRIGEVDFHSTDVVQTARVFGGGDAINSTTTTGAIISISGTTTTSTTTINTSLRGAGNDMGITSGSRTCGASLLLFALVHTLQAASVL